MERFGTLRACGRLRPQPLGRINCDDRRSEPSGVGDPLQELPGPGLLRVREQVLRRTLFQDDAVIEETDAPITPEGVKTEESDTAVTRDWADVHLDLGIEAMTEIATQGEPIKHFTF